MQRLFLFGIASATLLVSVMSIGSVIAEPATTTTAEPQEVLAPLPQVPEAPIIQVLPPVKHVTTSLLFVGDIMLDRNVQNRTKASGSEQYPFALLGHWLNTFDYTVANLEGPLTDTKRSPQKSIDFSFVTTWLKQLQLQGIDAVSQANNHALDQGRIGYQESVQALRKGGILVFGDQVEDGLVALATTTIHDTSYAFLGWNTTDNPMDKKEALQAIRVATTSSDVVIAYLHWGNEYKAKPDQSSIDMAHWLIDQGIDVVIGGHPHWSQGVSVYKEKPIIWSLGNFIFDQDWSEETQMGLAVSLAVVEKRVQALELYPISIPKSQPQLMQGQVKIDRLAELAKRSDPHLADAVRSGRIELK